MSSKASEILGVSAKKPHVSHRRNAASRDADSLLSVRGSRFLPPGDAADTALPEIPGRALPSRGSRAGSRARDRETTSYSVASNASSVRFADKPLSSRTSALGLRQSSELEPPSPGLASARAAPSSWRGLASRAGGSSLSIGSRTSQDSMSTLRDQPINQPPPSRNKNLLKSALSRFTIRPSKSKNSLASSRESRPSTGYSTTVPSVAQSTAQTAAATRHGTPRSSSPSGVRLASPAAFVSLDPASGIPKIRQNSRMPTEVQRHPTRPWLAALDDIDVDGPRTSPQNPAVSSELPATAQPNGNLPVSKRSVRHFSRPLIPAPISPKALESHPRDVISQRDILSRDANLVNTAHYSGPVALSNGLPRKRRSKPPELQPHDYSILNLSDSDEEQILPLVQPQHVSRAPVHRKNESIESTRSSRRETALLHPPPSRSIKHLQPAPRVVSVLRFDDSQAHTSPSLPSLVGSASSRQTSFISSASHGRSIPSDSGYSNAPFSGRYRTVMDIPDSIYQDLGDSYEQMNMPGVDSEDEPSVVPVEPEKRDPTVSPAPEHVMTALSPEEVAWLAHMRQNRADTLRRLNPPAADQPPDMASVEQKRVSAADTATRPTSEHSKLTYETVRPTASSETEEEERLLEESRLLHHVALANETTTAEKHETILHIDTSESEEHGEQRSDPYTQETSRLESVGSSEAPSARESPEPVAPIDESDVELDETTEWPVLTEPHLQSNISDAEESTLAPSSLETTAPSVSEGERNGDLATPEETVVPEQQDNDTHSNEPFRPSEPIERVEQVACPKPESSPSTPQRTTTRPRQHSITYAEAKAKFEKSAGRSSLPVPKRIQTNGTKANSSNPSSAENSPLGPRIPVAIGKLRQVKPGLHRSTLSQTSLTGSSSSAQDQAEAQDRQQAEQPPTPKLASFPQPPSAAAAAPPSGDITTRNAYTRSKRDSASRPKRRDTGARDVLEAWQALGGG